MCIQRIAMCWIQIVHLDWRHTNCVFRFVWYKLCIQMCFACIEICIIQIVCFNTMTLYLLLPNTHQTHIIPPHAILNFLRIEKLTFLGIPWYIFKLRWWKMSYVKSHFQSLIERLRWHTSSVSHRVCSVSHRETPMTIVKCLSSRDCSPNIFHICYWSPSKRRISEM